MLWDFTKCSICSGLKRTRVVFQLACRGDEVRPDLWSKNKQKKKGIFFKKGSPQPFLSAVQLLPQAESYPISSEDIQKQQENRCWQRNCIRWAKH